MPIQVYISTSLHNARRAQEVAALLQARGATITYAWWTHGQVYTSAELRQYGYQELEGVRRCDVLLLIQPGRAGSHVELGLALAWNKPVVLLEETPMEAKTFYYLDGVRRCADLDTALASVLAVRPPGAPL